MRKLTLLVLCWWIAAANPLWALMHYSHEGDHNTNSARMPDPSLWDMLGRETGGGQFAATPVGPYAFIASSHASARGPAVLFRDVEYRVTNAIVMERGFRPDLVLLLVDGGPLPAWVETYTGTTAPFPRPEDNRLLLITRGGGRGLPAYGKNHSGWFCDGVLKWRWALCGHAGIRFEDGNLDWWQTFEAGPTGDGGIMCPGDSSSPGFILDVDGRWKLLGPAHGLERQELDPNLNAPFNATNRTIGIGKMLSHFLPDCGSHVAIGGSERRDELLCAIVRPVPGERVVGPAVEIAAATGGPNVSGVQFLLDGKEFGKEIRRPPYRVTWNASHATPGQHSWTARVRNPRGTATSAPFVVTPDNQVAPMAIVLAPANKAVLKTRTKVIVHSVGPSDGAELLVDGKSIARRMHPENYDFELDPASGTLGWHKLRGRVFNARGTNDSPVVEVQFAPE